MKRNKTYWAITGTISLFMLYSAYYSGTNAMEFARLGFPNYFRIELTLAKVVGAVGLLIPQVPTRIKEWIYVAFGIVLVSAAIAKFNSGYSMLGVTEPLFVLAIMVGSTLYLQKFDRASGGAQPA